MKKKRDARLEQIYKIQKKSILPLSKREFFIAGLFLYWGEGTKCKQDGLSVSNSDPSVIKFFMRWLYEGLKIPKNKTKIGLHLYNDMNIDKEMVFWSETLKIPLSQFTRPYIKKTSSERINHKGSFGHGTCNVRINNTPLAEKIFMGLKVISNRY